MISLTGDFIVELVEFKLLCKSYTLCLTWFQTNFSNKMCFHLLANLHA